MKAIIHGKLVFPEEIREGILLTEGDRILRILAADREDLIPAGADTVDAQGLFVGPGFIDEHLHGYSQYGEDFDILRDLESVAKAHLKHGTTTMTPSPSYSLRLGGYLDVIRQAKELMRQNEEARADGKAGTAGRNTVAGIHLEGPYINPHMGAGRKFAWKYSDEVFEQLFAEADGCVLHCTYAPEMPWAENVERILQKHGVVMDIGHTDAGPADMERAVAAGVSIVTHLFDGMGNYRGMHASDFTGDPQDCVSDVALGIPGLYYELICDSRGAHVTKHSRRLARRAAGEDHIILISDATCWNRRDIDPADFPEDDLRSAVDLNVTNAGVLFGSRLTVSQCAKNYRASTGAGIREAFKAASTNAAKALGLYGRVGSLEAGKQADLVFVDEDFTVKKVMFAGELLPEVRE